MPTLLFEQGFKFFFYANDHAPAHVHIMKGDAWVKIEIATLQVVMSNLKSQELKTCLALLEQHQDEFQEKWNEWFNR
jgi:hypothetical protein